MRYWIRTERKGEEIFGNEEKTFIDWHALEASGPDAAVEEVIRRRHSVGQLRDGVTCEVYEVHDLVGVWHGQYDKEPMEDMRATNAELVIARRLDLEPSLREHLEKAKQS
jgi:hypothetical protein